MFEYNSEIDYLFSKKIIEPLDNNRDELYLRGVFNGEYEPNDIFTFKLKSMKTIMNYIKEETTLFNSSSVKEMINMYYTEDKYKIINNDELLTNIIDNYVYIEKDSLNIELFINLIENNIFNDNMNNIIAPLIYNFLLLKHNHFPLIFKYRSTKRIIELIRLKEYYGVLSLFTEIYIESKMYNTPHLNISLEEIIDIIISNKEYLMNNLHIESLYIYGSYAKGTETKYSDLDMYITIKNSDNHKYFYAGYFKDLLDLPVDVKIYEKDNLDGLNNNQKKYIKKVL